MMMDGMSEKGNQTETRGWGEEGFPGAEEGGGSPFQLPSWLVALPLPFPGVGMLPKGPSHHS